MHSPPSVRGAVWIRLPPRSSPPGTRPRTTCGPEPTFSRVPVLADVSQAVCLRGHQHLIQQSISEPVAIEMDGARMVRTRPSAIAPDRVGVGVEVTEEAVR